MRTLFAFTLGHGVMEFLCGNELYDVGLSSPDPTMILLYTACAFLLPLLIGFVADRHIPQGLLAVVGCLVVSIGVLCGGTTFIGAAVLGVGNAAFHVGGGTAALRMQRPASAVGVFVSSGAIGLALGIYAGKSVTLQPILILALSLATAVFIAWNVAWSSLVPTPTGDPRQSERRMVWVLLAAVGLGIIRSFLITATPSEWKSGTTLVLAAAVAAALGKALGGIAGDRFGFRSVALVGVIGAAILSTLWPAQALPSLAAIVLINLTIPLVLASIARLAPGREGLVFGIGQAVQFASVFAAGMAWAAVQILVAGMTCVVLAIIAFEGKHPLDQSATRSIEQETVS